MLIKTLKFPLLALTLIAFLFSSCSKDKAALDELVFGKWTATSFKVDDEETLGVDFTSFEIEFDEYNGTTGTVALTSRDDDGDLENVPGIYKVNDADGIVSINADGQEIDFQTNISNNQMTLIGTDTVEDVVLTIVMIQ